MKNLKTNQYAVILSMVEIGLGSALHALHIPLAGQLLSLHQLFLMTLATKESGERWATLKLSIYAGFMKLGMGQGKKLVPMVAITMQGLLFNLGFILGRSVYFGAIFSASWALIQPFLIFQFLSWGGATEVFEFIANKAATFGVSVVGIILFFVGIKFIFAIIVCMLAERCSVHSKRFYEVLLKKFPIREKSSKSIWKEMMRPLFLGSLLLLLFYYWKMQPEKFLFFSARLIGLAILGVTVSRFAFLTILYGYRFLKIDERLSEDSLRIQ